MPRTTANKLRRAASNSTQANSNPSQYSSYTLAQAVAYAVEEWTAAHTRTLANARTAAQHSRDTHTHAYTNAHVLALS